MNIEEIKKKYKDEWVLVEVTKCDKLGHPIEGNLIAHSRNRDDTYEAMTNTKAKHLYHAYTGEIPTKGYAVAFQDTGATYTMLPWKIARVLGLKPEVSERRIDIITASGVESVPLVNLKSIRLFDKKVNNNDVIIHDLPPRSYVDGLLGLSFLRNFNLHLNFREGYLEME